MELDPRIRIRAPLRCDGIGRLDCAEDADSGARLAVRWLPLEANGDAAVRACEKLPAHPTLPKILQTGQVGASAFVALDFPQGELLSARQGEALDNEALLRVASQLSDALATVHSQGVVHGEMSTDSVLLAGARAFLWDMPLVIANRLTDRRGENRLMQNLVKTAPFLAPERARGEGASQASDVYALGAVLCAAAGASLPSSATTLGLVHQVATGAWQPRVPTSVPQPWRSVLERMVSMDPSRRPSSGEVAQAFAKVPGTTALPTVPEFPAIRLSPELLAKAEARAALDVKPAASERKTLEMPLVQLEAATQAMRESAAPAPAPVEAAPVAALVEAPLQTGVNAHTLDLADEPSEASAPEVVRVPTMELEAVQAVHDAALESAAADAAVVAEAAPAAVAALPSVQLTDTISVSHELAAAGAMALSAEEVDAIHAGTRRVWMVAGGIGGAVLALLLAVVVLAFQAPEPTVVVAPAKPAPVVAPAPIVAPAALVAPAPAPKADDFDLVPLPKLAAPAPKARPAPRVEKAAAAVESQAPQAEEPPAAQVAPEKTAHDFSFLESAEAPKSELKRPEL